MFWSSSLIIPDCFLASSFLVFLTTHRLTKLFCSSSRIATSSRRLATAATESSPKTDAPPPPATSNDPRLTRIVDDISGLTLLQAADLVSLLKVRTRVLLTLYLLEWSVQSRLNIQEIAMPAASAAPAAAAAPAADEPAAVRFQVSSKPFRNFMLDHFRKNLKRKPCSTLNSSHSMQGPNPRLSERSRLWFPTLRS